MTEDIYDHIGKYVVEYKIRPSRHLKLVFDTEKDAELFGTLLANRLNDVVESFIVKRKVLAVVDAGSIHIEREPFPHSRKILDREADAHDLSQYLNEGRTRNEGENIPPWLDE